MSFEVLKLPCCELQSISSHLSMMFSDAMNSRGAASRDGGAAAPLSRGAGAATSVQFADTISWLM